MAVVEAAAAVSSDPHINLGRRSGNPVSIASIHSRSKGMRSTAVLNPTMRHINRLSNRIIGNKVEGGRNRERGGGMPVGVGDAPRIGSPSTEPGRSAAGTADIAFLKPVLAFISDRITGFE